MVCALTKVTTGVFGLGEEAVQNMVGVVPGSEKNSFSSESSLSSSRVLKDRGRYPYRMAFLMTARSHLRYPHLQEGCLQGL